MGSGTFENKIVFLGSFHVILWECNWESFPERERATAPPHRVSSYVPYANFTSAPSFPISCWGNIRVLVCGRILIGGGVQAELFDLEGIRISYQKLLYPYQLLYSSLVAPLQLSIAPLQLSIAPLQLLYYTFDAEPLILRVVPRNATGFPSGFPGVSLGFCLGFPETSQSKTENRGPFPSRPASTRPGTSTRWWTRWSSQRCRPGAMGSTEGWAPQRSESGDTSPIEVKGGLFIRHEEEPGSQPPNHKPMRGNLMKETGLLPGVFRFVPPPPSPPNREETTEETTRPKKGEWAEAK